MWEQICEGKCKGKYEEGKKAQKPEWNAASLTWTDRFAAAIEVDVLVPVLKLRCEGKEILERRWDRWSFDATALEPPLLDPVNQVLLVGVVSAQQIHNQDRTRDYEKYEVKAS